VFGGDFYMDNNMKYSIQIAMLSQLLKLNMISDKEFMAIKNELMKKYKIIMP